MARWENADFEEIVQYELTSIELDQQNQILAEINTYKQAEVDKFIMGQESLDKFSAFVNNINKAGLPQLLKVYNDAYTRYKAAAAAGSK